MKYPGYGKIVVFSGPSLREARYGGRAAVLGFDHADVRQSSDGRPLRGFELAEAAGRFHPAAAEISGQTVVVRAEPIPTPRQVRFFFGGGSAPNLVNRARLPAAPFGFHELEDIRGQRHRCRRGRLGREVVGKRAARGRKDRSRRFVAVHKAYRSQGARADSLEMRSARNQGNLLGYLTQVAE